MLMTVNILKKTIFRNMDPARITYFKNGKKIARAIQ